MTTGPAHWELLAQARALDNQMFVGTISPARDESASYVAWGHSSLVDPWGKVIAKAGPAEEILHAEIGVWILARNDYPRRRIITIHIASRFFARKTNQNCIYEKQMNYF